MQRKRLKLGAWRFWAAACVSAVLLELPFPLAGPMPAWRGIFAWFALVPLLWAILSLAEANRPRSLRHAFLISYVCGVLWYAGNCYWIYDVMLIHGGLSPSVSLLLLLGFSLVLGLYFGLFGLGVVLVRRASGSARRALAAAPVLWAGLELAASRITSVPWDQLGYSQVDNGLLNELASWTGVYGISFVLVAVNALIAAGLVLPRLAVRGNAGVDTGAQRAGWLAGPNVWRAAGPVLLIVGWNGMNVIPPKPAATATAVLVQPNLDVGGVGEWGGPGEWEGHIAEFIKLGSENCKTYIAGIPETGATSGEIVCPPYPTHPDLVAWPESPAPYFQAEPRFREAMKETALTVQAPLVVGGVGMDYSAEEQGWSDYNSALIFRADGAPVGRYDKIHLVPYGEFVPYRELFSFAHKLTNKVGDLSRGEERKVFLLNGHRYGVFICYEAVFADEVREFSKMGAEVLVNISDDGWYGDTSAPWQHLNMARMRAIENRRWILRDTNNGVTAAIDPEGRVRRSIPRHVVDALPAGYGFRDDVTFYSAHGDLFGWGCVVVGLGIVGWAWGNLLMPELTK